MRDNAEAARIFQEMLDISGEAMLTADMPELLRWFATPNTVETYEGHLVLNTEQETRALFETAMARQREQGISHMIRKVTHAEFRDPDTIWAIHETRYVFHNQVLSDAPHQGFSILHRYPDCWKVHHAQFTVDGRNALNSALRKLGGVPQAQDPPVGPKRCG